MIIITFGKVAAIEDLLLPPFSFRKTVGPVAIYKVSCVTYPIPPSFLIKPSGRKNVGMLKKAASGVPSLRRSGFAQAGRYFAVLTYFMYAPRVNKGCALRDAASNTTALLDGPF